MADFTVLEGASVRVRTSDQVFAYLDEDDALVPATPSETTVILLDPNGTETDISDTVQTGTSAGDQWVDFVADKAGVWYVRFIGLGMGPYSARAVDDVSIKVTRSPFGK